MSPPNRLRLRRHPFHVFSATPALSLAGLLGLVVSGSALFSGFTSLWVWVGCAASVGVPVLAALWGSTAVLEATDGSITCTVGWFGGPRVEIDLHGLERVSADEMYLNAEDTRRRRRTRARRQTAFGVGVTDALGYSTTVVQCLPSQEEADRAAAFIRRAVAGLDG